MKQKPTYTKLRGGYYTPGTIAQFLADWAIRSGADSVLEPSCGDGVFLEAATRRLSTLHTERQKIIANLHACEMDAAEAAKARARIGSHNGHIATADFFARWFELKSRTFDVVLGNPPFIRYQNFPEEQRERAFKVMAIAGLNPTRLTNAWVPFVVCASLLLKPTGRLAMVLPAEIMQVSYSEELRLFLTSYFDRITVLAFEQLSFDGIQQETVLLLAERGVFGKPGIEVVHLRSANDLSRYNPSRFGKNGFKSVDHGTEKWTQYFLGEPEIQLIRRLRNHPELVRLGDLANVDIGVVTGLNDFFVIPSDQVRTLGLQQHVDPIVSRSNQLSGIVYRPQDWKESARQGHRVNLLRLQPADAKELPACVRAYISEGERRGFNLGYKCRIRRHWYVVPSAYRAQAFLLRQIHSFPKLVVNETKATSTDTVHRVRFKNGTDRRAVAAAFHNSLTFAFSELLGRSYGGGVLELEPNEADNLLIPRQGGSRLDVEAIDGLMRRGEIDKILEIVDQELLRKQLGLAKSDIAALRRIWEKLRRRRFGRRNGVR